MKIKGKKILYFVTRWFEGTAYKNINFMRDTFGGEIIKDDIPKAKRIITSVKPDLMVIRGDARKDYQIPLKYKIPYILIEHDVNSLRRDIPRVTKKDDKEKIENASAIIFTSEDHASYYQKLKKEQDWKIPYYEVIHTRPLKKDMDYEPREKLIGLHLVYAGGVIPNWNKRKIYAYGYRCYHRIFERFVEAGWRVHIYSASYNTTRLSEYKDIGCIVHENVSYKALLREMSQYTAGLHSYNKTDVMEKAYNYTQTCRGNKIWDYLAAGIPTIGYQGGNGMKIYDRKWGIIINDLKMETLQSIPERLRELKITKRMRNSNVMDRDIKKFRKIIEMALNDKSRKYIIPRIIDESPFPKIITVLNRSKIPIYRGCHIFTPNKETEPFQVNESAFKLIKAHVQLKINIKEN